MNIPKDPAMLLSFVNMKLRDNYKSLDEMCDDLELNRSEIEETLKNIDYSYDEEQNRFV
jgi:predicted solute-binding protein